MPCFASDDSEAIAEFYGFAYRPDWHADVDTLLRAGEGGLIIAPAAIKAMTWKPALCAALADRYP